MQIAFPTYCFCASLGSEATKRIGEGMRCSVFYPFKCSSLKQYVVFSLLLMWLVWLKLNLYDVVVQFWMYVMS
jgi:hypothetical protein